MNKIVLFTSLGVIIGLFCSLFGIIVNSYEINKCKSIEINTNQEYYNYELQNDCYIPLNKPEWNLFWNCFSMGILGILLFGTIGLIIGVMKNDDY